MKHSHLILLSAILIPMFADAAMLRTPVTKPSRGRYENVYNAAEVYKAKRAKDLQGSSSSVSNQTFLHFDTGLRLSYPSNWKLASTKDGIVLTPVNDENSLKGRRHSMISMSVSTSPQKRDLSANELDTYFMNHATISSDSTAIGDWYIPSFNLLSSDDGKFMGIKGRMYTYTGESQSIKYKAVRYFGTLNGKLYTIGLMSELSSFDADKIVFDKIVKSVQLKKSSSSSSAGRRR